MSSAFPPNGGGYPIGLHGAPPGYPFPEPSTPSENIPPGFPAQRPPGFSPAPSFELPSYSNPNSPQTNTAPSYTYPQAEQDTQGVGGTSPAVGYPGPPPTGPPPVYPGSPTTEYSQMPTDVSTSSCGTLVELSIRCSNLVDRDVLSKSDPMVIILMSFGGRWVEKGRTENIRNSLNPEFSRRIKLDYFFEENQRLRFEIYDIDNTTTTLSDDDFLGMMECSLGQIVTSSPFTRPLLQRGGNKMGNGLITVYADEVDNVGNREVIQFHFKAEGLDNMDFIGKSDPFLEIYKPRRDSSWQMVHRTEVIKNNLNPTWKPFEIRQQNIGGSNLETKIFIKCYDMDKDGSHDHIGDVTTTLRELLEAQNQPKAWPCINEKKLQKKGKHYKDSGTLILTSCRVTKSHSFLDYIFGGLQINFTVAIDFTASNGDPRQSGSLHYIHRNHPNEYTSAIYAVGGVVQDYDSDKLFPALGFGAKIPPHYVVSHEFALNFNMSNPFCSGVQGLVEAYHSCLMQVQLYGPTNFAPVINHVARFAEHAHMQPTPENYFILLILTDGVVTDMPHTSRAIVRASYLPMSIIIVGVGKADFSNMNFLDGDGGVLKSPNGTQALRDIVQFVPYYKFKTVDSSFLAKEVLSEVPQQLTEYYRLRNIPPKRPIPQIVTPT